MVSTKVPSPGSVHGGCIGVDNGVSPWTSSPSLLLSSLESSDTNVYEHYIQARLGTASHFCEVVFLKLRTGLLASGLEVHTGIGQGLSYLGACTAGKLHRAMY